MNRGGWERWVVTFVVLGILFGCVYFLAWGFRDEPHVVAVWLCLGLIASIMVGRWYE